MPKKVKITQKGPCDYGFQVLIKYIQLSLLPIIAIKKCCTARLVISFSSPSHYSLRHKTKVSEWECPTALRLSQRATALTLPVPGFAGCSCFLMSIHTHLSERNMHKAGHAKSTILKENTEAQNEIFMLRESGSWKYQPQWHENCQQEQIITQREFILMTMTPMR